LLIKYYPTLGRGFDPYTGQAFNTGVTANKNMLGALCLVLGFYVAWHFLTTLRAEDNPARRRELLLDGVILAMMGWLLRIANSATSLMALVGGIAAIVFVGLPFIDRRKVGSYLIAGLAAVCCLEFFFGLSSTLVGALGRDSTLTGRTEIWEDVFNLGVNPLVGAGFESFWLGTRLDILWAKWWWQPNQAHNGYVEMYLNLGWIGVIILAGWIVSALWTARMKLISDFAVGRLQLGLIVIVVVYSYTEAIFKALHLLWFAFFIITIDYASHDAFDADDEASRRGTDPDHAVAIPGSP
jgi:O-antigen ligase